MLLPHEAILQNLSALFGTNGHLAAVLGGGYADNPAQLEYARLVGEAIGAPEPAAGVGGEITLLEAGTGTGKSLGYLLPLVLNVALTGERALISTHTNHLADQLLNKDGPAAVEAVRRLTGKSITLGSRKGRRNFVDFERVDKVLAAMTGAGADPAQIARLAAWRNLEPSTFAEAFAEDMGLELPDGVSVEDICVTGASSAEGSAAYNAHVAASHEADILITNHSLTLIDAKLWNRLVNPDYRIRVAVFDEADALPEAARSLAETKVPTSTLKAIAKALIGTPFRAPLKDALEDIHRVARQELRDGAVVVDSARHAALMYAVESIATVLDETLKSDEIRSVHAIEDEDLTDEIRGVVGDLKDWLAAARSGRHAAAVLAASPARALPALVTVELKPARILGRLWNRRGDGGAPFLRSVVLTSATLSAPGSSVGQANFSDFMDEIGVHAGMANFAGHRCAALEPVGRFGTLRFELADRAAPVPTIESEEDSVKTNPAWLDYVAAGVRSARARGGRVFVLTTSYADAEAIGERVRGAIVHRRGLKLTELVKAYAADPAGVIITPAAWSGLSLDGLIDHLVIARIPFGMPDPARDAVFRKALDARGIRSEAIEAILRRRAYRNAMRKLRQGLGRAIRRRDDVATIWILDPRFPIPAAQVRDLKRRLTQGPAEKHVELAACIPPRFRDRVGTAYERARLFAVPLAAE